MQSSTYYSAREVAQSETTFTDTTNYRETRCNGSAIQNITLYMSPIQQLKTFIPSYSRHTWTHGSETSVMASELPTIFRQYYSMLLNTSLHLIHSLYYVQGRVSCLKYFNGSCWHSAFTAQTKTWGHLKGRNPGVDGKIILKVIWKNCDVMVGLDLSGFSMSPCIHVHCFPCLLYLLGLSCLPSGRLIALSSFHTLKNDPHLSSEPLYPYLFQTWQYQPKTFTRREKKRFLWAEPMHHKHKTCYQIQPQSSATDIYTDSISIAFFHTRSDQPKLGVTNNKKRDSFGRSSPRKVLNDETGSSSGMRDRKRKEPTERRK
jgi:hypothetical protein